MIDAGRITNLNGRPDRRGSWVLYWMQASQRAQGNHALELAIEEANRRRVPCVACFGLTAGYPEANARHYRFMLEGLAETQAMLADRGVALVVQRGEPDEVAAKLARRAALVVVDAGWTHPQRAWRRSAARSIGCTLLEVDADAVVPVRLASAKEEYAAATLRPKIGRLLERFLVPLRQRRLRQRLLSPGLFSEPLADIDRLLAKLGVDGCVAPAGGFRGGASEARRRLKRFIEAKLDRFEEIRNDPSQDGVSHLSPYLHFGQIASLEAALAVRRHGGRGAAAFLEEIIVRRELAMNFCLYNPRHNVPACLPAWAQRTLARHGKDRRPHLYARRQLEAGRTHDPIWNAAQREMVLTGKMHGYMRMYWGKKILEWTRSPAEAFRIALALNNRYELDGRDPNGFAGVAWCLGKHDRPWGERPIFGQVRFMNDAGLRRKFDIDAYVARIATLAGAPPGG